MSFGTLGNFGSAVLLACLAAICAMALFFAFCRRYEDGIVGHIALGAVAFATASILYDALMEGHLQPPSPLYCLLIVGLAAFMLRHGWRFAMFHWHGHFGWRRPQDRPANNDSAQRAT